MKHIFTAVLLLAITQSSMAEGFEVVATDSLGNEWSQEVGVHSNGCVSVTGRFSELECGIRKLDFRIYTEPETSDATRVCEEMGAMLPTSDEYINLMISAVHTASGEKINFETEKNARGKTVLTIDGRKAFESVFGSSKEYWTSSIGNDISRITNARSFTVYGGINEAVQRSRELSVRCIRPKAN